MGIELAPNWREYVARRVAAGDFQSEREVIEAALSNLQRSERWSGPQGNELALLVREGIESAERDGCIDGAPVMAGIISELERRKAGQK